MTRAKKALQREQTPTSSNFLTPATFKGKRNTAASHDQKYCKGRATDIPGSSLRNCKHKLESSKWTARKVIGSK